MVKWLDNAIFYEIYPQSFQDTNSDGIGDFEGIISRLDYICDLGCNALWLNPCFDSPFYDAGYDVADYYKAAPRYGTNDDLKRLFDEAHKRGMHVLLDLVPGHTSVEHEWFRQSMKAERNEYTDRYIWSDNVWNSMENVQNITGCLRGISDRNGCAATNFFSTQPALNYGFARVTEPWQLSVDSPAAVATREAMQDIMAFWLRLGCDGFRVDMAGSLVKQDDDSSATIALWNKIRDFLNREFPDAVLVSEWGDPEKSIRAGFHMDFLLHFGPSHYLDLFRTDKPYFSSKGGGDLTEFIEKYLGYMKEAGEDGLVCFISGNHDMDRMRRTLTPEEMKLAFAFLLTMPGAPFIYYGDEIGMRYVEGLHSVEGGFERTGSRSPMQWSSGKNAGFSDAPEDRLYISIDPAEDRPNVESQLADENSLLNTVKKLTHLRLEHEVLQSRARFEFICCGKLGQPLVYTRTNGNSTALIAINPSCAPLECICKISETAPVFSLGESASLCDGNLIVPPRSFTLFL